MNSPIRAEELSALFEEYRALYGLVEFRMSAMDRRVPVTAAAFAGAVASLQSVPSQSQAILLAGLPVALYWFMRATVNHARSKEDVLRRIEEIERSVNKLIGKEAMRFQSHHPNRRLQVGGRTGRETVLGVLTTVLLLQLAAAFQATGGLTEFGDAETIYLSFLAIVSVAVLHEAVRLSRYSYVPTVEFETVA